MATRKEVEDKVTQFWESNKVFERSVSERPIDKEYVFYDGPPFATGVPHHGHILSLTCKDVFPRFWTMKGFRVERRWGWDCHGLPIENIAEKDLGIKDKKQIEEMGVDKFNEYCRSKVLSFAEEWKKTVRTMGKWIEFDNSYKTMDTTYMESVWWIFKKLFDEGHIYEGKKVLMYCPRCQTPLANSEIQMDNSYKDVTEKTATVAFKIKGKTDEYLLAWTTTPWTLIGNVALAVNVEMDYVLADVFGKKFVVAKALVDKVFPHYEVVREMKGKDLLNIAYEPLYTVPTEGKKGYYVIDGGSDVTAEDGTGIVHMAIYGEFDYKMIRKFDLPLIQHIGKDGKLIIGPDAWKGKWFKKIDEDVLEDLYARGQLVENKSYTHSYPFCYRCETPLIYNAVDSWFVDIEKVKHKLLARAEEVNWYPDNFKEGRFKYILETAPDWTISRNRFWATAIPVWKCDCGGMKTIGSIKELSENAVEKVSADIDLHKHVVDKIHLKCKCGKLMTRVPEVLDCWFESGAMPYAAKHYPFESKDWMAKNYPADFVSEYTAQVRAWFYYMHVLGVLLMDRAPFKHVVVSGNILAADGAKMSKSKKNYTDPNKLFDAYGADAMRFYLMSSQLMRAQDLNFLDDNVKEVHRKLMMMLSNVNNFYGLFGKDNKMLGDKSSNDILDKWMVSETERLIRDSTRNFEEYNTTSICADALKYVDDLSTWFVRRSRDRFKSEDAKERNEAMHTLAYALDSLAKVLAPITPFISEEIYQTLRGANFQKSISVHLEKWPEFDEELIDDNLRADMVAVREVITKALDERKKQNVAVKQPLASLTIFGPALDAVYFDLIKDELNVKEVILKKARSAEEPLVVELDLNLTKDLLLEGASREVIRQINDFRKESGLTISDRIELLVEASDDFAKEAVTKFEKEIMHAVQCNKLTFGKCDSALCKEVSAQKSKMKVQMILIKK